MSESRANAGIDLDRVEVLTSRSIRSLLMARAEEILRSLGSIPVLGPALEEARPVDPRILVRSMAPHLRMN